MLEHRNDIELKHPHIRRKHNSNTTNNKFWKENWKKFSFLLLLCFGSLTKTSHEIARIHTIKMKIIVPKRSHGKEKLLHFFFFFLSAELQQKELLYMNKKKEKRNGKNDRKRNRHNKNKKKKKKYLRHLVVYSSLFR